MTPELLSAHVTNVILPNKGLKKTKVSKCQMRRWLIQLGYRCRLYMKNVYWDGHERVDVVKKRKEFLKELECVDRCVQHVRCVS